MTDYRNNPDVKELRKIINELDDPMDKLIFERFHRQLLMFLRIHKRMEEAETRISLLEKTNLERALGMK